ncbi:MAG: SDR family oxidoreductase [Isosphaeraceae bacterium]
MVERDPAFSDMGGKTCVVTGGTSGIGAVAAEGLASAGARVLLVGRNPERCEATVHRIKNATGNDQVEAIVADLSSMREVRRVAEEIRDRSTRLDVLLNNAGAMFERRRDSVDGLEMTWALNHLAYFLLTNLLVDRLTASVPARVVSVASDAHRMASGIDFDDPLATKRYGMMRAYAQSKLANVQFSAELARRLEGQGVTSNALHPGFVVTSFFDGKGWAGPLMKLAARATGVSAQTGAQTSLYLASSPELDGVTGRYFYRRRAVEPSRASQDVEAAARLWRLSEEMTGLVAKS